MVLGGFAGLVELGSTLGEGKGDGADVAGLVSEGLLCLGEDLRGVAVSSGVYEVGSVPTGRLGVGWGIGDVFGEASDGFEESGALELGLDCEEVALP